MLKVKGFRQEKLSHCGVKLESLCPLPSKAEALINLQSAICNLQSVDILAT